MLALNLIVFRRLRRSKAKVGLNVASQQKQSQNLSRKEYKFIVSALFIDLVFVLYYTPIAVYISIWVANLDQLSSWESLSQAVFDFYFNMSHLFMFLYSVSTIFIFVVFNSYFKQELIDLFRLRRLFSNIFTNNLTLTISSSNSHHRANNTNLIQ